jgi:hypothetical protein
LKSDYDSIKPHIIRIVKQRIRSDDWKDAQKRLNSLKK